MVTMKTTETPAGTIEVRVRHLYDEGSGALLGYFPPQWLSYLPHLLEKEGVYFNEGSTRGYQLLEPHDTQFVVEDGRVFYEIVYDDSDDD